MRTDREAAVFIRRGDEFLLLHRRVDRYWHVVAGVVEDGESFAEAAARELFEEAGLQAEVVDLGLEQGYRVTPELRDQYGPAVEEVTVQNFWVEAAPDWQPVLNEEHDEHRWCSLSDAIALAHWPETAEALVVLARPRTPPGSELAAP